MEHLSACPVCSARNFSAYLSCKDHTVSHETFQLEKCEGCGFVVTNPRPNIADLPKYYQSEEYISHSDTSTNLVGQVYKIVRTFTLKWKYDLVRKHCHKEPSSILDYGCGTGAFLSQCRKRQMRIAGVEPSAIARKRANEKTSNHVVADISEVIDTFEAITLWHVLEHVSNLNETVARLKDCLKENGTMFIAVPNLQSNDARRYREYWAGYDVPRHLWHFSKSSMTQLLAKHNLKLTNVLPMPLDAFYVSLLSEKYRTGKNDISGMTTALLAGSRSNTSAKNTGEYSSLIYIARQWI